MLIYSYIYTYEHICIHTYTYTYMYMHGCPSLNSLRNPFNCFLFWVTLRQSVAESFSASQSVASCVWCFLFSPLPTRTVSVAGLIISNYGVATISRLLKIIGIFCKRALWNRRYSAEETYDFKEPNNRSHPIFEISQCLAVLCTPTPMIPSMGIIINTSTLPLLFRPRLSFSWMLLYTTLSATFARFFLCQQHRCPCSHFSALYHRNPLFNSCSSLILASNSLYLWLLRFLWKLSPIRSLATTIWKKETYKRDLQQKKNATCQNTLSARRLSKSCPEAISNSFSGNNDLKKINLQTRPTHETNKRDRCQSKYTVFPFTLSKLSRSHLLFVLWQQ